MSVASWKPREYLGHRTCIMVCGVEMAAQQHERRLSAKGIKYIWMLMTCIFLYSNK